jgi:hypothetical protein
LLSSDRKCASIAVLFLREGETINCLEHRICRGADVPMFCTHFVICLYIHLFTEGRAIHI